jgi:hypothetical protein
LEVKVIRVERPNGKATRVWLQHGAVTISFVLNGYRLLEVGRTVEGCSVLNRDTTSIPPAPYQQIIRMAYGILSEDRKLEGPVA